MTINANSFSALKKGLKVHYTPESIRELIRRESPLMDFIEDTKDFEMKTGKGGGRNFAWSLIMDRAHNVKAGTEDGYFPGFSGSTNDDIDRVDPQEATMGRATFYADVAFTSQQMASAHKSYELFQGWGFAKHVKMMQDDLRMYQERCLLNDGTGILGIVESVALSSGNTVVTLKDAAEADTRGILGTQRLQKNMKVSIIRNTDWTSNARTARIHSNIGGSGTSFQKVVATSGFMDVGATPTVTLSGDLISSGTALAAGDVIVEADSRPSNATGGSESDDSGLRCPQGLFSWIDDGTLNTKYADITRSSYTQLNSITDLSNTLRKPTWLMLQVLFDKLYRRRGSEDKKIEDEYVIMSERSVRTNYVYDAGEAGKRYIQEGKAKTLVSGFGDVTMAFVGNDYLIPWVALNTFPYGHMLVIRKKGLEAMWDIPVGIVDDDSLSLRQIEGKPQFYLAMQGVGQYRKVESWFDARLSGLEGRFSAS